MLERIKINLQYLLPKQLLTQFAGWFANKSCGMITTGAIKLFIKCYKVDMQEAEKKEAKQYATFNAFFSRKLAEDARPIVDADGVLVFPADGVISQFGDIVEGAILQAKGHEYTLDALLACHPTMVKLFANGLFATTYLSPTDYHRLHMPCDATLREMIYVPGSLFSVNQLTSENIPNLFARNERVICLFDTEYGPMAQILVGATIVGSIETTWHGKVTPPRDGIMKRWTYPADGADAIKLAKGEEMGCFKLGSTVINLFAANSVVFTPQLQSGFITRVGTHFADRL